MLALRHFAGLQSTPEERDHYRGTHVGFAMYKHWQGSRLLDPVKVAHSYFIHPNDSDWQDELVSIWAGAHPDNIKDSSDAAIFEAFHHKHAPSVDQSAWERLKKIFD